VQSGRKIRMGGRRPKSAGGRKKTKVLLLTKGGLKANVATSKNIKHTGGINRGQKTKQQSSDETWVEEVKGGH